MKPGFGAAIGLTFQISSRPSFNEIFFSFIKNPKVNEVARDFPAKQWTKTFPLLFKAEFMNVFAWATKVKIF